MARHIKLSLDEVFQRVLESWKFSSSDLTDSDLSEDELEPYEMQSQLFESGKNPDESQYYKEEPEPPAG